MIKNISIESNCKRIAKDIMKQCKDPEEILDIAAFGKVFVTVSDGLISDFKENKKAYIKNINKGLKDCSISNGRVGVDKDTIVFDIEFDDVDAEMEDW